MKAEGKIQDVIVPVVTPFKTDGQVDHDALRSIIKYLIKYKSHPFVLGTTGEYASIPSRDRDAIVKLVCSIVNGQQDVYAGIASNSFEESIEAAKKYFDFGVKAVVAHLPNYYPLNDAQMLNYFETLAENIPGPLIIYNIPVTVHHSIPVNIVEKLSYHQRIVALKDSERDLKRMEACLMRFKDRPDFNYLTGWGTQMAHSLKRGASGIVPGTGNLAPRLYFEMMDAASRKNWERVEKLQMIANTISEIYQKNRSLSLALSTLKVMMNELSLCSTKVLMPLTALNPEDENKVRIQFRKIKNKWSKYFE